MSVSSGGLAKVRLRRRFTRVAVGAILILVAAMLVSLVGLYLPAERRQLRATWEGRLAALADDRAAAIAAWAERQVADATVLAAFPTVVHLATGASGPPYPFPVEAGAAAHLARIFDDVAAVHGYQGIYLVDGEGRQLAASSRAIPLEPSCLEEARAVVRSGRASIDFHAHTAVPPVVAAAAPVWARSPAGAPPRVVGAVLVSVDPQRFLYPFVGHEPTPSRTAETLLVRRQGQRAQFLSPLRHRRDPPLTLTRPLDTPLFAAAVALAGVSTTAEFVDYRGVPVLAATRPVPGTPWALVTKVDRAEVFAPLAEEARWVGIAGAAFLLAVVAAALALVRVRSAELEAALAASRARFAALLDEANDAILVVDASGRIREANRQAEVLYGYPREALLGKSLLTDLRPPETREVASAQLARGMSSGEVSFETLHLRADGTVVPVEVNSRKVEWAGEGAMLSIVRDIRERVEAEGRRAELLAQVRALAARLAEVEEGERQAMARELHDRVGQTLTALGLNLSLIGSAVPEEARPRVEPILGDARELVVSAAEEIRDVMATLRPPVLDDYGLAAALHMEAERLARRSGVRITVDGSDPEPRLPSGVETALFRACQEALTNVVKHAHASHVTVTLEPRPELFRLVVSDDGVGFDATTPSPRGATGGWGILGMGERLQAVGGRLTLESAPGRGTRVIMEVDTPHADPGADRR